MSVARPDRVRSSGVRDLPLTPFVRKRAYVHFIFPGLVRCIGQPAAVGGKGRVALIRRCLQECFRFSGTQPSAVTFDGRCPDVVRGSRIHYFVVCQPLSIRGEREWSQYILALDQQLGLARPVGTDPPEASSPVERDVAAIRAPY